MSDVGEYTHEISIAKTSIKGKARVPDYLKVDKWYPFKPTGDMRCGWYYNTTMGNGWNFCIIKNCIHLNGGNWKTRRRKDV